MTDVIPPATLYSIHPYEQYTAEQNNLWKQLFLILDQIYLRTGGTTDDTTSLSDKIESVENQTYRLQNIQALFQTIFDDQQIRYYSVSSAHTTSGNEFVRVTATATVTLNSNPKGGEEVWVQPSSDIIVTVSGDVNDQTEYKIHRAYDVAHFKYIDDAGEWVIQ